MRKKATKQLELYRILEIVAVLVFITVGLIFFALNHDKVSAVPVQKPSSSQVTAMASAMPNRGIVPMNVYFSAFGSESKAGGIKKIEWDLDANGLYETDATNNRGYAEYQYDRHGLFKVGLRITDDKGNVSFDNVLINVKHPGSQSVDYETVFDDSQVRKIVFYIPEQNWDKMWENPLAKYEVKADVSIFGELLKNVGLKMRGQFSLASSQEKKPWEFNTDTFVDRQEYMNLKQLMFLNNIGDPSLIKEKLAYDMFKFAGVPSGNITFVELWIDITDDTKPAEYWGIYTMVERIDNKFIGNRFGNDAKGGNLYKASHAQRGPMDLHYYGDKIEDYPTQNGLYAYGKNNNEEKNDYSDVLKLIKMVDGVEYATPEDFATALEQVFNVDSFLRYFAVAMTLGMWDFYPYTGNNYYLFNNGVTGKFEWIPWDLTWDENEWEKSILKLGGVALSQYRPLYDNVLAVNKYKKKYAAYIDLLTRYYFNSQQMGKDIEKFNTMLMPYITKSTGDKAFSVAEGVASPPLIPISDFTDSKWKLITFINSRSQLIQQELSQNFTYPTNNQ